MTKKKRPAIPSDAGLALEELKSDREAIRRNMKDVLAACERLSTWTAKLEEQIKELGRVRYVGSSKEPTPPA